MTTNIPFATSIATLLCLRRTAHTLRPINPRSVRNGRLRCQKSLLATADIPAPNFPPGRDFARTVIREFRESSNYDDRRRNFALLGNVLKSCRLPSSVQAPASTAILSQLGALEGEAASAFYRDHRDELHRAFDIAKESK